MALTTRDEPAYDFIRIFRMARVDQVDRICYNSYQLAAQRLARMAKDGIIYRRDDPYKQGLLYSYNPVKNRGKNSIRNYFHAMIVNETYILFKQHTDVTEVYVEKIYDNIQVDMVIKGTYEGEPYCYLVEVETDRNLSPINYDKYNHFLISKWREHFDERPKVLYVTNKQVKREKIMFDFKVINCKGENFIEMLKGPCE